MHEDRGGDHLMTEQYHLNLLNDKIDIKETSRPLYLLSKINGEDDSTIKLKIKVYGHQVGSK